MIEPLEIFRSVEVIWVLWLAATLVVSWLTARACKNLRRWSVRKLLSLEHGGAYSISYIMVFPIYLLLVCLIVECTLVLIVKMGTIYAAYAGARSQVTWLATAPRLADLQLRRAAVHAMTPFASSSDLHARGAGIAGGGTQDAQEYVQAYRGYSGGPATDNYLLAKHRFAERATSVSASRASAAPDANVEVTLTYQMPFNVPGIGRILGARAPWPGASFYTYAITSKASMPLSGIKPPATNLGIGYDPAR